MNDLLIKNGIVVTEKEVTKLNISVNKGKISSITEPHITIEAKQVVDAEGLYLFPGVIDAHMHVKAPFQNVTGELTFFRQSISAAYGGVTTFADFSNTFRGDSVVKKVNERIDEMQESAIDFAVHGKFVNPSEDVIAEIPILAKMGVPTFKMFMTYSREKVITDDLTLYKIFHESVTHNCLPMVHAESDAIADWNFTEAKKNNCLSWKDFANCKPINCELEAFQKAVLMAIEANSPLLIVHTTNKECLDYAQKYQQQGNKIYVETCPHYLTLFQDLYDSPQKGHLAMCSPPLRTLKESEALWDGIRNEVITLTGSDDCTFTRQEKEFFLDRDEEGNIIQDFTKVVNGISGIELRLPILLTEGYHKRDIRLETICKITSTEIARVMGMYPKKGAIRVGSDADIAFVDLNKKWNVSVEELHNGSDYSLHEGYEAIGKVVSTMLRGEFVIENENFVGTKYNGNFVQRYLR